ncbi:MAG: apolipoprotein N-acyltransferase [Terriglobia bacterium]
MRLLLALQRYPTACALLSGVLLVLCFPRPQLTLLAWVALTPLLVATFRPAPRTRLFFYGYLAGGVFFAGTCSWIYNVIRIYGHLSALAAGSILLLFVLVQALYFGLFSLITGELARRWQLLGLFLSPFVWVALEWARSYVPFGGFPWNLLGYAVAPHIGWIQPAAYTGIYGVSFLVAGVNALVAGFWLVPSRRGAVSLGVVALVLAGLAIWGRQLPPVPTTATALLVQTNLPQQEEFDPRWVEHHPEELRPLEQLTREAVRALAPANPALVVWPEVPVSFYFHHDPVIRARLLRLAQATRSYFLVGVVDYRRDRPAEAGTGGVLHPYNSAVLLSPAGELVAQYDKIHLVPFGEYLPLADWLGFLEKLVPEVSDFRPGRERVVMPTPQGGLAIIICYEAVYPGLVRQFVERGADVLVNISNDGWFGRSAAPAQHLNMARVRAVETRRFLLRATNTGITAVVDPFGRVVARAPTHTRTVLAAGFGPRRRVSFYVRTGDWLAALCALVVAAALARKFWVDAVEGTGNEDNRGTGKGI